jgi:hypothetical protein
MYEPMIKPSLQIMEATNSMPAHEFVGAQSSMDINDPQSNNDGFSTPRKTTSIPLRVSIQSVRQYSVSSSFKNLYRCALWNRLT